MELPRGKFIVVTGVSGSGKSSLAFDTLYAEGQRRFAQSLSSYARQFLGRMSKPDVDSIEGIPPAIAIEQRVNIRNPRSTIATTTEIYDYLRVVFARIGVTYSPVSGKPVTLSTANDVLCWIFSQKEPLCYIATDIQWSSREDKVELMLSLLEEGYTRMLVEGKPVRIDELIKNSETGDFPQQLYLLLDRVRTDVLRQGQAWEDTLSRVLSSIEAAFKKGDGAMVVSTGSSFKTFTSRFEADGISFTKPEEYLFSFNSPLGACPVCGGLGKIVGVSEDLVVPDKSLSVYDGAIACWRGDKMGLYKDQAVLNAERFGLDIFTPYCNLDSEQKSILWDGREGPSEAESIVGINDFFKWVEKNRYKIQYKYLLARYSGKTTCHACGGSRLRKEALYVRVGGKNISELLHLTAEDLLRFFKDLSLNEFERSVAGRAVEEICSRLQYICDVGLGYLTLDRASNTLSGGESQRINLVTALGSSLVGSMYILDEPSIGLHPRDTKRLIGVLERLRDLGNTVVVVEHDEEIMRAADLLVDMGPKAGEQGGEIVFQGTLDPERHCSLVPQSPNIVTASEGIPHQVRNDSTSLTLQYLLGLRPRYRREKRRPNYWISIEGAMEHNLKDITVRIPLNTLTVVAGVSGSGKSSLVGDILYPALFRRLNDSGQAPGVFRHLGGSLDRITRVEYVDQNPIGRSLRSNAVTYLKIYDDIRKLYSAQQYAKINGYTPAHFSFNQDGGRCPECQGEGFVKIGMQFMADVTMVCESCGGKRFKPDILEVRYKGKNIADVLDMSVEQAIDFFGSQSEEDALRIARRLQPLVDVGLSYIKLGQSSSTLSGGESQRIKLAYFLSMRDERVSARVQSIMFIFDEPTTGLHFYDVEKLLKSFDVLLEQGHSIVVVEHNPDVIKAADWVIELGPDAGDRGGEVVFAGTPEDLAAHGNTSTTEYIKCWQ